MSDVDLLEQHRRGDDDAFRHIVARHIGWVYGVARRRVRDAALAEDVAQAVFVLLHRKMPRFSGDAALVAWIHKAAWYATETALRDERRRRRRESEAAMIQPQTTEPDELSPEWDSLAGFVDEMISELGRRDREAILLRFYGGLSFGEMAQKTGSTAEAVRKRVDRAIENSGQWRSGRVSKFPRASLLQVCRW